MTINNRQISKAATPAVMDVATTPVSTNMGHTPCELSKAMRKMQRTDRKRSRKALRRAPMCASGSNRCQHLKDPAAGQLNYREALTDLCRLQEREGFHRGCNLGERLCGRLRAE